MPTVDDDNPDATESLADELAKVELNSHQQQHHIHLHQEHQEYQSHQEDQIFQEQLQQPQSQSQPQPQHLELDNNGKDNHEKDDNIEKEILPSTPIIIKNNTINQKLAQAFVIGADDVAKVDNEDDKLANDGGETDEQMIKRKETVMLMSLKRRAELEAKRAIKENELARSREQAEMKKEMQELRKLEYKQRREAILEQYRLKKKAAEAAERGDGLPMGEKSSTGGSATNLSTSGSSGASSHNYLRGPRSMKSSQSHHTSVWTLYNGPKLFAKPTTKTNLILIQNAILKALEGAANAKTLKRMQDTITSHSKTCGHFLILFRSRHQFRGLYEYDDKQNTITKLDGIGPKSINNEDILKYYKFDSPKRQFTEVQTRHISLTIIAFTIQDHLWSKTISSRVSSHDLVHHQQQQPINQHPQALPQRNGH